MMHPGRSWSLLTALNPSEAVKSVSELAIPAEGFKEPALVD